MSGSVAVAARPWRRVKWTRAAQLAPLLDEAVNLDGLADRPPAEAFAALYASDRIQATRFVAQCLPRMDAVQWVGACLQRSGAPVSNAAAVARKAAGRWVREPSDMLRRQAFEAGEKAGWATADGAACLAIFLSGGSMAPPEQEQGVQPPPGAFGQAVAGAVLIAALSDGPAQFETKLGGLLRLAEAAAAGDTGGAGPESTG